MTPDTQGPTNAVAGGAGLIATLYAPSKKKALIQALQDRILKQLNLAPKGDDRWSDEGEDAILVRFVSLADDTTVLQLALNASGDAAGAWKKLRTKLKSVLDAQILNGIWGYTLIYQAVVNPEVSEDQAFEALRPYARPLDPDKEHYTLAQAGMGGGRIWLLAIPTEDTGPAAATVYVALSDTENETPLIKTFYGEDARLLMPELIAHKGYYEKHQYRGENLDAYKKDLKTLREIIRRLLDDVGQRQVEQGELNELTLGYDKLVKKVWDLESLRVSMARQLYNYDESSGATDNDILEYHRRHIETANSELKLLVAEGQYALGVANPVLSLAQLQADKDQQKSQQRANTIQQNNQHLIQTLLAVAAAALAVPQLIDKALASRFLEAVPVLYGWKDDTFAQFGAQIVLIAILAVAILPVARRLLNKLRERQSQDEESPNSKIE